MPPTELSPPRVLDDAARERGLRLEIGAVFGYVSELLANALTKKA